jgi:hypothetical protein
MMRPLGIVLGIALGLGLVTATGCLTSDDPWLPETGPGSDGAAGEMAGSDGAGSDLATGTILEVLWTIDSATSTADCVTYGIDAWQIDVVGPGGTFSHNPPCTTIPWTTGTKLGSVTPGLYAISVEARDKAGQQLARISRPAVNVAGTIYRLTLDFTPADLGKP